MHNFLRERSGWILAVLLAAGFFLMLATSHRDAAIVDELAHIPAGYAYDHYLDYRLNPEHPPLIKALAAVPLQFISLKFPTDNQFWTTAVNGEWGVGGAFLYGLGNSAAAIIGWARLFPILITLGLIAFIYFWARELHGPAWALLPAALLALSPIIISEGHFVTTDIGAAFGIAIGLYTLSKYLRAPSRKNILLAGIGFGIAQVTKFSAVVLIPLYAFLVLIYYLAGRIRDRKMLAPAGHDAAIPHPRQTQGGFRYLGQLILIYVIGTAIIIYPLYALFTAHYDPARQLSDTVNIMGPLAAAPCSPTGLISCFAHLDVAMAAHAVTRPLAEFLLGILIVFERISGSNVSYFLGQVYDHGTPLYFPVVYVLKETLPVVIMLLVALLLGIAKAFRSMVDGRPNLHGYILDHFPQCAMIIFIAAYWAWSIEAQLNIGVRHLLPVIPLSYLLATGALKGLADGSRAGGGAMTAKKIFIGAMLIWLGAETAFAFPYYLSYFNELAGGPWNGYRYVTDSNYDWGQDMLALQAWMQANPQVDKLALDFFGASNPAYYLGDRYAAWQSSDGNPAGQGIHWFAASINNLQDAIEPLAPGATRAPGADYSWLTALRPPEPGLGGVPTPDARVGTTIFIYHL